MISKAILAVTALALAGTTAFALPPGVHINRQARTVTVDPNLASFVPSVHHVPKGSSVIFSNDDPDFPKGVYFCCYGFDISGPDSALGFQSWEAIAFTPKKSVDVTEIEAGIGYLEGDKTVNFGIWSDADGVPGTEIAGGDVTVPETIGQCCALVTFKKKVPITGGTQYWIAGSTDSTNTTAFSSWLANSTDVVDTAKEAGNDGSGWVAVAGVPAVNVTVYGK
ncbi:MAG TPA: choice-of-anchor R domain-containing protein [Rhizomicrobium sp.]|nr:choice-of-anchor R domain-containing protein [Rhizomicrobium sp.]